MRLSAQTRTVPRTHLTHTKELKCSEGRKRACTVTYSYFKKRENNITVLQESIDHDKRKGWFEEGHILCAKYAGGIERGEKGICWCQFRQTQWLLGLRSTEEVLCRETLYTWGTATKDGEKKRKWEHSGHTEGSRHLNLNLHSNMKNGDEGWDTWMLRTCILYVRRERGWCIWTSIAFQSLWICVRLDWQKSDSGSALLLWRSL